MPAASVAGVVLDVDVGFRIHDREIVAKRELASLEVIDEVRDGEAPVGLQSAPYRTAVHRLGDVEVRLGQDDDRLVVALGFQPDFDSCIDSVEQPVEAQRSVVGVEEALTGLVTLGRVPAPEFESVG